MILDIDTQYNIKYNEKSMLRHIYLYTDEQSEQNFSGERKTRENKIIIGFVKIKKSYRTILDRILNNICRNLNLYEL